MHRMVRQTRVNGNDELQCLFRNIFDTALVDSAEPIDYGATDHQMTCDCGVANALSGFISPRTKADRCVPTNIRMLLDLMHEHGSWQLREHPFFEPVHGF